MPPGKPRLLVRVSQILTSDGKKMCSQEDWQKKLGTQGNKILNSQIKSQVSSGNIDAGRIIIGPSTSTPRYLPRRKENKDLYANIHSSTTPNRQKVEASKVSSSDECIGKMWSIHVMAYHLATKGIKCWYMLSLYEPQKQYANWKKPVIKEHTSGGKSTENRMVAAQVRNRN